VTLLSAIPFIYGGGVLVSLFIAGVVGARFWAVAEHPGPAWLSFLWPLAAPAVLGMALRSLLLSRRDRKAAALAERQKWLAVPVESLARREPTKETT
jgi:hypothetical protein